MLLASLQNVTKLYGTQTVLRGASFQVSSGRKLGLIGPNGSGKTTVLRILLGKEPPTDGVAFLARGVSVGYVPQYVEYDENETVLDHVLAEHRRLADALREQEHRLADASSEEDLDRAMRAYQRARDEYDRIGGDHFPQRAQEMLDGLGLAGRGDQKIGLLSGGERNVLSLTQALLARPEFLILDEPGNHLDFLGVAWLEDFLASFKGAVLVVSHNRYLLDRVVDGILELENGRITYYGGGYSSYRAEKLQNLIAQQKDYVANQRRLARLEALVARLAVWAQACSDPTRGKRLRARRSQLEREQKQAVEKPVFEESAIRADFSTEATRADIALQIRGYAKAFGDLRLFDGASVEIACGERVALVGPNGCGKTTLLRDIVALGAWEHPTLRVGPSLRVGYCAQQQEVLQADGTVLEAMMDTAPITKGEAASVLARFLFGADTWDKRIKDLSGGERNRLQLARLMVLKPNFLILDEPTNHLDIPACEAIEEALADFEGTILVVSHDRYFLDKIANRVVEVRDRKLVSYRNNFSGFWHVRKESLSRVRGRVTTRRKEREEPKPQKTDRKAAVALERRIQETEQRKLTLEGQVADAFSRRDLREGHRLTKQLEQVKAQLEDLYEKWMADNT